MVRLARVVTGSPLSKLRRAMEHLNSLDVAIQRWADTEPCRVVHERDPQTREESLVVYVDAQPTDAIFPLLTGEIAHTLRHSLDHIAYRLAISVHGTDPPPNETTTEFPAMTIDAHQLDSELPKKIAPRKDMPNDLYAAIEGLQPYHGGKNQALALIHDLDNLDKHRFAPIVAGNVEVGNIYVGHFQGQITQPFRTGPVEHGAAIFAGIPDPGTHVQMETNFRPSIAFGNSSLIRPGEPVYPLLYDCLAFVQNTAFPALESFL
jgi:hypothetical protein